MRVWVPKLDYKLVAVCTPDALCAEVKVADIAARVVPSAACDLEMDATPIADQACTLRDEDLTVVVSALLILPSGVES